MASPAEAPPPRSLTAFTPTASKLAAWKREALRWAADECGPIDRIALSTFCASPDGRVTANCQIFPKPGPDQWVRVFQTTMIVEPAGDKGERARLALRLAILLRALRDRAAPAEAVQEPKRGRTCTLCGRTFGAIRDARGRCVHCLREARAVTPTPDITPVSTCIACGGRFATVPVQRGRCLRCRSGTTVKRTPSPPLPTYLGSGHVNGHYVKGYYRKDGTYVSGHYRSPHSRSTRLRWS